MLYRTILPLPGRDDEGRKVIIIRATIHDAYKHKQDNVLKVRIINLNGEINNLVGKKRTNLLNFR